jgi:hypothetical protein
MRVQVRGGYAVRIKGKDYQSKEIIDISEEEYNKKPWIFDVLEFEVVTNDLGSEDVVNRSIEEPIVRRGIGKRK